MPAFKRSTLINAPASRLREWHFREGAFKDLSPPWEKATVLESPGALSDGARAVIEVGIGPLKQRWVAVHEITETGFIDRQESGPFASWEHRHDFLPVDENRSRLVDWQRNIADTAVIWGSSRLARSPLWRALVVFYRSVHA